MAPTPRKPLPANANALTRTLAPEASVVTVEDLKQLADVAKPLDELYRHKAAADAATLVLSSLRLDVNEEDPSAQEARKTIVSYLQDQTRSEAFLAAIHEQRRGLLESFQFKHVLFPTPPPPPPSAPPLPAAPHRVCAPHDAAALLDRALNFKELFQFYYSGNASPANLDRLETLKLLPKNLSERRLQAHLKAIPTHQTARVFENFFDPKTGVQVEATLTGYLKCKVFPTDQHWSRLEEAERANFTRDRTNAFQYAVAPEHVKELSTLRAVAKTATDGDVAQRYRLEFFLGMEAVRAQMHLFRAAPNLAHFDAMRRLDGQADLKP